MAKARNIYGVTANTLPRSRSGQQRLVALLEPVPVPSAMTGLMPPPSCTTLYGRWQSASAMRQPPAVVARLKRMYEECKGSLAASAEHVPSPVAVPRAQIDLSLMTPAYLTGQSSANEPLNRVSASLQESFARMNSFYKEVWRPQRAAQYPGLPSELSVVSGYRSFDTQAQIVAGQLLGVTRTNGDDAVLRSALLQSLTTRSIPGFSRHHWGTDIDVVSADSQSWKTNPTLIALADFTRYVAPRFGFYTPYWEGHYPRPDLPHYNSEPWHLSYYPAAGPIRERWLAEFGEGDALSRLLDQVAVAIGFRAGIPTDRLRRVLGTLDLPSYQRNVTPPPS